MAKTQTPAEPQTYIVRLNGAPDPWEVEAATPEDAIKKVIAETQSLRDRRNYTALPKTLVTKMEGR